MVSGLVSFVVQMAVFFLQVELDPVVKTNNFCSRFRLSNKDVLKSTWVQAGECFKIFHQNFITLLHNCILSLFKDESNKQTNILCISCLAGCSGVSPGVSLSVVEVEPDQLQLTLKLPQVGARLSFAHQVPVSSLWRDHINNITSSFTPYRKDLNKRRWAKT